MYQQVKYISFVLKWLYLSKFQINCEIHIHNFVLFKDLKNKQIIQFLQ